MALALSTVGFAFLAGAIIISSIGKDPLEAFYWLFQGAFSPSAIPETFIRATPLLLISLGLAVVFTARVWNIGAEGQFYIGGMMTAILSIMFKDVPAPLALPVIILIAGLGGAFWALTPAILKTLYGINEVITTLMLNYVAIYLVSYLLHGPFRDPISMFPETETINPALWIPIVIQGTRLHLGVLLAFLVAVPLAYLFLKRAVFGLKLDILGSSPRTAQYANINTTRLIIQAMLISGFLAGLAGGFEVLGIQHKMRLDLSPSTSPYGYTGIAVALLGYLNPLLIALTSFFLGGIINGSMTMHRMAQVPVGMAGIIQALIIIFVLMSYFVEDKLSKKIMGRLKL
ncbi:MAG: ABC transporter permease [Nitrososphaerota archaeon]|nr:ABC transporter permease [Aigarchaeota archaeon]MDW8077198.1 ABC transporter permease [Nitrososphaerota archaeon]